MPGLKAILLETIKQSKLTQSEMETICKNEGYRISNGERRLRELADDGIITAIKSDKGANIAWTYNPPVKFLEEAKQPQLFTPRRIFN